MLDITLAEEVLAELISLRRTLHQQPEVAFVEHETTRFICDYLSRHNISYRLAGDTGVWATIESGRAGRHIAFRADIDALPVEEANEFEYKSERPGFMHACGHDAHTAILLVLGRLLQEQKGSLTGRVTLLFQPAEEAPPGGALGMIDLGVCEGVDAIYALHVTPELPVGKIGIANGPMMAASDQFSIEVIGRGGHGASPHQTVDAVLVGCQLVNNLQAIVSRNISPQEAAVVSVGVIKGGFRFNVIADTCLLEGTVRTLQPTVRETVRRRLEEVVKGTVEAQGATYTLSYEPGYPPVINQAASADIVRQVACQHLGNDSVVELAYSSMGGEDFAYFLQRLPGAFFRLGTKLAKGDQYPLHNPRFDIEEDAMLNGLQMFLGLLEHHMKVD